MPENPYAAINDESNDPYADINNESGATKSEQAYGTLSFLKDYGAAPLGLPEAVNSAAGGLVTKSVAGLSGIAAQGLDAARADDAYDPGQEREDFEGGRPRLTGARNPALAADTVGYVEDAGREIFKPTSVAGEQAEAALGKAVEGVGTAIKYPLSAVPFSIAALREGGNTGTEERAEFMELPMSQYLGELAQDNGASPIFATLAHMIPDAALVATGYAATKIKGKPSAPKEKPVQGAAPTIEQLKAESSALYKAVDDAGITIKADAFESAIGKIMDDFFAEGGRQSLTPKTYSALQELRVEAAAGGVTISKVNELRKVLGKAR